MLADLGAPLPREELVHAEREQRAGGEHEPVEVYRHLVRVENRDERNRRQAARKRRDQQLEDDRGAGAWAFVAVGEMTVTTGAGGHAVEGRTERITRRTLGDSQWRIGEFTIANRVIHLNIKWAAKGSNLRQSG